MHCLLCTEIKIVPGTLKTIFSLLICYHFVDYIYITDYLPFYLKNQTVSPMFNENADFQ